MVVSKILRWLTGQCRKLRQITFPSLLMQNFPMLLCLCFYPFGWEPLRNMAQRSTMTLHSYDWYIESRDAIYEGTRYMLHDYTSQLRLFSSANMSSCAILPFHSVPSRPVPSHCSHCRKARRADQRDCFVQRHVSRIHILGTFTLYPVSSPKSFSCIIYHSSHYALHASHSIDVLVMHGA